MQVFMEFLYFVHYFVSWYVQKGNASVILYSLNKQNFQTQADQKYILCIILALNSAFSFRVGRAISP